MKYTGIRLKNYTGIFNGSGLYEVSIDLTKATHNMIIIRGDNGSGKSTLFNAISILPDSNENFLLGMQAEKEITINDNGVLYVIKFIHSVKSNGDRDTTKAYISKYTGDAWTELNPNGNVSSYKDIVYDLFGLNTNFAALSQLTSEDKGLVMKRPAERKKFVNSILSNVEAYNDIYKTLTKRSSVLKSMMTSIIAKLDQIGDVKLLESQSVSINNRLASMEDELEVCEDNIAAAQAVKSELDPNNDVHLILQDTESRIKSNTEFKTDILRKMQNKLIELGIDNQDSISLNKVLENILDKKAKCTSKIQYLENYIEMKLNEQEQRSKDITRNSQRLISLQGDIDSNELRGKLEAVNEEIELAESLFRSIGTIWNRNVTKRDLIACSRAIEDIDNSILAFKDKFPYEVQQQAISAVKDKIDMPAVVHSLTENLANAQTALDNINDDIDECNKNIETIKILENRPQECKIDSCPFIKAALDVCMPDPHEMLIGNTAQQSFFKGKVAELKNSLNEQKAVLEAVNAINNIIRLAKGYSHTLSNFSTTENYTKEEYIIEMIWKRNPAQCHIDFLSKYIDQANVMEEYHNNKLLLANLEAKYDEYVHNKEVIEDIQKDINDINEELTKILADINKNKIALMDLKEEQKNLIYQEQSIYELRGHFDKVTTINAELEKDQENYDRSKKVLDKVEAYKRDYETAKDRAATLKSMIDPLYADREKVKHALSLASEYTKELKEYSSQHEIIETIKFYSSPTTGIQVIFMDMYMTKILDMANNMLQNFFDGRFVIQPFILNENEFRIPVQGNGILNDDISSMSSGEQAILSMIISFSLLFNSSSRYNILKLDEIDAPLDSSNRLQFANLLQEQSKVLGIDQLFLISHNNEIDTSNCDIIVMRTNNQELYTEGNVIFRA